MYTVELPTGDYLHMESGEILWFEYKRVAQMLANDIGGKVWERSDFTYCI